MISGEQFDMDRTKDSTVVKQFDQARLNSMSMIELTEEAPVLLPEPRLESMRLEAVLQALGDPVRLQIVHQLKDSGECRACGSFDLPVGKSTASHHFKVLREAGVIRQRVEGRERRSELRSQDLEQRFPGLLASVLAAR
jgi:DNA-binding transcriptional ArsR family regulator